MVIFITEFVILSPFMIKVRENAHLQMMVGTHRIIGLSDIWIISVSDWTRFFVPFRTHERFINRHLKFKTFSSILTDLFGTTFFLTFPACFSIPIIFSNLNFNCLRSLRNLQEQVKKASCYQKLFWPFTIWINYSSNLKIFANSWPSASNCKSFEITSERSERFLVTECFFNLFLVVSHI